MRTSQTKKRIDKTQQNSKCALYGDLDETIKEVSSWSNS